MIGAVNHKVRIVSLVTAVAAFVAMAVVLFDATGPAHAGAFPGANGKIAYMTTELLDGGEIYSMDPDGANQANLSRSGDADQEPSYSASGKKIAFTTNRDGNREIYTMNSNGTLQTRLTRNPDTDQQPSYSPEGKKIAFSSYRDGNPEIYTMNSDGTGLKQLTNTPAGVYNTYPAWSPDGTKIAFSSNIPPSSQDTPGYSQIWVMRADGTNPHQLTTATTGPSNSPSWSPSGTKIAYDDEREMPNHEIYLMNADGSHQTNLTNNSSAYDIAPAYSPNGKKIAFASDREGGYHIYTMRVDGSNQTLLGPSSIATLQPSWQPLH